MTTINANKAKAQLLGAYNDDRAKAQRAWESRFNLDATEVSEHELNDLLLTARGASYTQVPPAEPKGEDLPKSVSTKQFKNVYEKRLALRAQYPNAGREPTGIPGIDEELVISPGKLFVFAGREGSGKSAALLQMSAQIATRGPVLYFHTEMPTEDIIDRLVACNGHIEKWKLLNPSPDTSEIASQTANWLENHTNLVLIDAANKSHEWVIQTAREYQAEFKRQGFPKLRALVLDNLHGVGYGGGAAAKAGGTAAFYGKITKDLIDAGKPDDLDVPILLAHHVNRTGSNTELTKARVSGANLPSGGTESLGGSDQIGNDAHAVVLVSVDKQNDPRDAGIDDEETQSRIAQAQAAGNEFGATEAWTTPGEDLPYRLATWHISKNRDGGEKFIHLHFYGAQQRFVQKGEVTKPLTVSVNTDASRDDEYNRKSKAVDVNF